MEAKPFEIIIGQHSIIEAAKNPVRGNKTLYLTQENTSIFQSIKENINKFNVLSAHQLQEQAQKHFKELDLEYQRIPSQAYLVCESLPFVGPAQLYDHIETKKTKILCLDRVTDVHNAAAILRTAAFFGVDFLVTANKGSFGVTPSFSRIASGALEYVHIVRVAALPRFLTKMSSMGVVTIGLSEHSQNELNVDDIPSDKSICLVLGAEDVGLSHAVLRTLEHQVALKPSGKIKSLNVSVAAAITLDRFF